MPRTMRLLGTLFASFQLLAFVNTTIADQAKPNVIVILVDDLGYGDLSSYGAKDLKSPRIDALAEQGMKFSMAYANCPVCSPTRASLLTGRYPELVGVPGVVRTHPSGNWGFLSPNAVMLPTIMKKQGYLTAIIGKWHLGLENNKPHKRGFDFFHGFLGDMMDDYYKHRRHGIHYMRRDDAKVDPEGHATDIFSNWAIDYLNERKDKQAPFFLYLAYNAPHTPIQPPKQWFEKVKAREAGITDKRAQLVALIEHMDYSIGTVVDALKTNGQWENTLLIFASDNGGQLNVGGNCGNLRGGKQEMYEGGIRVPMCAVWPGKIKAGSHSDLINLSMDIYPTVIEAAGGKVEHEIEGVSILPTLLGKQQKLDRDLFWTRREGGNRFMGKTIWAVRRGDWKLLQNNPMQPFELFNLKEDPLETRDLSKRNKKKFNELATALRAHIQRGGRVPWQGR